MASLDIQAIQSYLAGLEKQLEKIPQLKKLKKQIKPVQLTYVLGAVILLTVFLIYVFSGLRAITNLVAFVYPAYKTIKALESTDKNDDTLWLSYWLFYGFFSVIESLTDVLFFWIPFYELFKMVFYIYLYAPQLQGAVMLHQRLVHPLVPKIEQFESTLANLFQQVNKKSEATSAKKTTEASKKK